LLVLSVPLAGDGPPWAKLSMTSRAAAEQRVKAAKTRGLKMPELEDEFFCMGIFSSWVELISYETNNRNWNEMRMHFIEKIILDSRLSLILCGNFLSDRILHFI